MASRSFGSKGPAKPHLVRGSGGVQGEISDLRSDVEEAFTSLEGEVGGGLGVVGEMAPAGLGASNSVGATSKSAPIGHVHAANFGLNTDMAAAGVAAANAAGSTGKPADAGHVHAMPYSAVKASIGAADSALDLHSQKLTSVLDGSASGDAVNKGQLDAVAAGGINAVKMTKTITFADFAGLTTEDEYTIDMSALPANARIVGHELVSLTPFNDGAADPDVTAEVGIKTGDVDAIVTSFNIAHDGSDGPGTSGVKGYPFAAPGGTPTLAVKVTTNNAAHLVGLDAGSVTINVFYVILA